MMQTSRMQERTKGIELEMIDAHCHLNLFDDPVKTVAESLSNGVSAMISAGGSAEDNIAVLNLLSNDSVFGVVGISPDYVLKDYAYIAELAELVRMNRKIVGIGEVGLDYKSAPSDKEKEKQREAFSLQIDLANELHIPLVVHSRVALTECIELLSRKDAKNVMFHHYEGSEIEANLIKDNGYFISIPPTESSKRKRAVKAMPIEQILVETDSPVVGAIPSDVLKSIELVAKYKEMSVEEVARQTSSNTRNLFFI